MICVSRKETQGQKKLAIYLLLLFYSFVFNYFHTSYEQSYKRKKEKWNQLLGWFKVAKQ